MPREVDPDEAFDDPPDRDVSLKVWERRVLETMPPHKEVRIPRFREEHILGQGYYESVGEPRGQDGDYRRSLEDGRGLHVKDYGDRMTLHWDKVDPSVSRIRHLVHDAPALTAGSLVAGAVGAAALRSVLRRK